MNKLSALLALPVVVVALTGCGSGSSTLASSSASSQATTTTPPTPVAPPATATASTTTTATSTVRSARLTAKKAAKPVVTAKTPVTPAAVSVTISARSVPGLGVVLVNADGHTLYTFAPDGRSKVTCTDACAAVWPPVLLGSAASARAAGQVQTPLLSSDPYPSGGRVATYAGWPLYSYVSDTAAGSAAGQALNLNGGLWYAITPAGTIITKKP